MGRQGKDVIQKVSDFGSLTGAWLVTASPGMRIIKTVLAVLICLIVDYLRQAPSPFNAAVAAIVCLQPDMHSTWISSLNRALGTLLAGLYSFLFLWVFELKLQFDSGSIFYVLAAALALVPFMLLILRLGMRTGFAIASIVYISILFGDGRAEPLADTLERVGDTLIGIAAALLVNWLPFLNVLGTKLDRVKEKAERDKAKLKARLFKNRVK